MSSSSKGICAAWQQSLYSSDGCDDQYPFARDNLYMKIFSKDTITLSVLGLLILFLATPAIAGKKAPGGHLNIDTVTVVKGDPDTLLITGEDFDFGDDALIVNLGSIGDLVVTSDSATEIVAELPADLPPGDYLLTVHRNGGQSSGDEYDLTIGLTRALADVCNLYVLTENSEAAPDYCCSILPSAVSPVAYSSPGEYTFKVPAGVTSITVTALGAQGGYSPSSLNYGASVTSVLSTTPCETLTVLVGGQGGEPADIDFNNVELGTAGGLGGFNGGGNGGQGGDSTVRELGARGGYGGGGASEVRRGSDRLVVAGGGGGRGGNAGGAGGDSGSSGGDISDATGGGAGSGGSGGSAGTPNGASGGSVNGGDGGQGSSNVISYGGGGGGGGGYGGGGGGGGGVYASGNGSQGAGGGGGGSLGDTVIDGSNSGDGSVSITF
jgi:hypothetical protein